MKEKLLQYIWQFQYFNKSELITVSGEPLQIIHQGSLNTNQGADFSEAKIKIGDTTWAGNIELHIKSSDWNLHKHSGDKNYGNIILHVVWEHDAEIKDISGNNLPTLELQTRVSKLLLAKYETLLNANSFIPCENHAYTINDLTLLNWKQRLLAERLEAKSAIIISFLNQNNFHWEETFWWLLAINFGIKVNSQAFEKIARTIPVSILAKHKNQIHQLEALLFGQAGLLGKDFTDDYPQMLQKEYLFYKTKYKLQQPQIQLFFLRMRPANFPTIRLAQLAMLINKSTHLFSKIKESVSIVEVKELLDVTANDYWHYHYVFDEDSAFKKKKLGKQMINNILINTVVPILFSYGLHRDEQQYKDKAIAWLEDISYEKNFITKGFETLKFSNKNSFDSQSYIQLKNEYCNSKRCLECAIGNSLLKGVQEI
ncbi:MAG TPA: DUF2851 family protein [Chitinophagaceae bacterium]|nr:DUF2851 family protein [Chitinophagaceae bacterium]